MNFLLPGGLTLLEVALIVVFLVPLTWTTNNTRKGQSLWPVSLTLLYAFVVYLAYYAITSPAGKWFPPLFSNDFWRDPHVWWQVTKYLTVGLIYSAVEMLFRVLEERRLIQMHWYTGVSTTAQDKKKELSSFCWAWNSHLRLVQLNAEEQDTEPQASINSYMLKRHLPRWVILWPAFLLSLIFGKLIYRVSDWVSYHMADAGTRFVRRLFRNTFKI